MNDDAFCHSFRCNKFIDLEDKRFRGSVWSMNIRFWVD